MPKAEKKPTYEGEAIALGPLSLAVDEIATAPVEDYAKNGVVLWNQRVKATIKVNGTPVVVTASLYVAREPLDQAEADKVADVRKTRDAAAATKKAEANETLAKEKRAAFDMGLQAHKSLAEKPLAAQIADALAVVRSLSDLGINK